MENNAINNDKYLILHSRIVLNLNITFVCSGHKKLLLYSMSKSKIKKKDQKNLKIFKSLPERFIGGMNNKIENFYQDFKKNREKRKLRLEKEKKIQEQKEIEHQKKQAQKDKIIKAKEEKRQILAQ